MGKHAFCSEICSARGEPLAGTGSAPERALLLAWPRGKWRNPRWDSVDMSEALKRAIQEANKADVHVALVDKVESDVALPMLRAVPENIVADFADQDALAAAILGYAAGHLFSTQKDERINIMCCTDSRRDACCARHGFATYKALVSEANPEKFNVLQCTHIGGCRFAASLIVMPSGRRYGRMRAEDAPAFLAALERNEVYLPAYKGNPDLAPAAQVAEIAALNWAQQNGFGQPQILLMGEEPKGALIGHTLAFGAEIGGRRLEIEIALKSFYMQGNCAIVSEDRGVETPRWCLEGVREAV